MEKWKNNNDAKLRQKETNDQPRMSKKRLAKLLKVENDDTLNETEKQVLLAELRNVGTKKQKQGALDGYKDSENYITSEREVNQETKINSSSLWGDAEKNFLEDVTMNLVPDDDAIKNIKGKTAMKWDNVKKRYMLKKVDRDGKVIAEKRNESGQKITKKMKGKEQESIYKKWQQRTHLSLQKTGEVEDKKTIDQAKRATEARKTLKDFKNRHGSDLYKGQDARSHSTLIEKKKRKFMDKVKQSKGKDKSKSQGRQYSDKAMAKI